MPPRLRLPSGLLAAAALLPPLFWLLPALARREVPTLRDQADFFFPLKLYTADRLRAGEIPLWNPLSGTGEPWLANAQSGVFYPPTLLFLIPSAALAAFLFLLLHFGIGAAGIWRFCKEEGASDPAALFAAALWTGAGPSASLSAYWNHFGALAYLPAVAALARSGLRTRSSGLALAGLLGLQAMAGSPEMTAATLVVGLLFALAPRPEPESGWRPSPGRPALRFAGNSLLGLALAAWLLVPLSELALHSGRRTPLSSSQREAGALGLETAGSLLGVRPGSGENFYLASLYLGPLALLAAVAAFAKGERRRLILVLASLGAAGLLFALSVPPASWLRELPGLDRVRYPAKALSLTVFALSVLSGLGLDALRFLRRARSLLLLSLAAAAGTAWALLSPLSPAVRIATAAGIFALLTLAWPRARLTAPAAGLQVFAALSLILSLALAGRSIFRFAPQEEIRRAPEAGRLPLLPGRVLTPHMLELAPWVLRDASYDAATLRRQRQALIGYTNLLAGVRTVRTAAALPTAAIEGITESIDRSREPRRVAVAAGAASARGLWTPYLPVGYGSKRTGEFFLAPINPYRPRLSFVRGYRVEPDPGKAWSLASTGRSDPATEVVLEREPPLAVRKGRTGFLLARLSEDRPERVIAQVHSASAGLLVLTDLFYPGWRVEVNGRRVPLLRADGYFRAVALPAGENRVDFRYRPLSFFVGAGISVAGLLLLGAAFLAGEPVRRGRPG